jgi:hypothetical protein
VSGLPAPDLLRPAESVLAQIRQRRYVDVINRQLKADHIHYKHFVAISHGVRGEKHFVGVQTYMFDYLLPVQFDTAPEAAQFLEDVEKAYK